YSRPTSASTSATVAPVATTSSRPPVRRRRTVGMRTVTGMVHLSSLIPAMRCSGSREGRPGLLRRALDQSRDVGQAGVDHGAELQRTAHGVRRLETVAGDAEHGRAVGGEAA